MTATQTAAARLHYDLADLRELRANGWRPCGQWITIACADDAGNRMTITTNGAGEGEFSDDYLRQYVGTCQFSICGWSDARARRELRRRYEDMMEARELESWARG